MIDLFFTIGLFHYLILSLILFMTGLLGVLISRNMLRTVMSLFIMSIAVVINFVAFGCYCDNSLENANSISMFDADNCCCSNYYCSCHTLQNLSGKRVS